MTVHRNDVLSLLLGVGGIAGIIGVRRVNFCAEQHPVLDTLMLVWGLLTVLLFVGAAAAYTTQKLLIFISSFVIFGAIGSLFMLVNVPCLAASVWIALVWVLLGLVVLGLLIPYLRPRLVLVCLSLLLTAMLLEGGTRLVMRLFPINTAWPIQPDEHIGWRFIPNQTWEWRGSDPACISFHVQLKSNREGFYDIDHTVEKPASTIRIAMIGDSFTESAQVQFEERAYRRLEAMLGNSYETLNFGISNFSVGQFMLTYEHYAAKYQPDYVFITLFYTQFLRNVPDYTISRDDSRALKLRPVYTVDETGQLHLIPPDPNDLNLFPTYKPFYRYAPPARDPADSFLKNPYDWLVSYAYFARLMDYRIKAVWQEWVEPQPTISTAKILSYEDYQQGLIFPTTSENEVMRLHFHLLREFADRIEADGGELVIVNYAESPVYEALEYFAEDNGIGYIDLTARMAAQKEPIRWLCDSHWNALGNEVAARAMYDWLMSR